MIILLKIGIRRLSQRNRRSKDIPISDVPAVAEWALEYSAAAQRNEIRK